MSHSKFGDVIRVVRSDRSEPGSLADHLNEKPQPAVPLPMFSPELSSTALLVLERDPRTQREISDRKEEARQQGLAQADAEIQEQLKRYRNSVLKLDEAAASASRLLAEDVVDLALVVAEEVIGHAVSGDHSHILATVAKCLASAGDSSSVNVRVCGQDSEALRADEDFDLAAVQLQVDSTLRPGDCVVETAEHAVDSRLQTRLANLREQLIGLLTEPGAQ